MIDAGGPDVHLQGEVDARCACRRTLKVHGHAVMIFGAGDVVRIEYLCGPRQRPRPWRYTRQGRAFMEHRASIRAGETAAGTVGHREEPLYSRIVGNQAHGIGEVLCPEGGEEAGFSRGGAPGEQETAVRQFAGRRGQKEFLLRPTLKRRGLFVSGDEALNWSCAKSRFEALIVFLGGPRGKGGD